MQEGGELLISSVQFPPLPPVMSVTICEPTALMSKRQSWRGECWGNVANDASK